MPNNGPLIRIAVNLIRNPMHFFQLPLPPIFHLRNRHFASSTRFNEMNELIDYCLAGNAAMRCCPCNRACVPPIHGADVVSSTRRQQQRAWYHLRQHLIP